MHKMPDSVTNEVHKVTTGNNMINTTLCLKNSCVYGWGAEINQGRGDNFVLKIFFIVSVLQ